jgi:sensor histidine kinase regulating citrate/malate metabolism
MKKLKYKFKTKVTLFMILVQIASISIMSIIIGNWAFRNIERREKSNIMNTAYIISNSKIVRDALINQDFSGVVQGYVEVILNTTTDIEVVVIADMKGMRYGHPNPDRVGEYFVGGDEKRVIQNSEAYISEAVGTLGSELRAFVPIYNNEKTMQIGFVMVGTFTESLDRAKTGELNSILLISFIGVSIGILVALILSKIIQKDLLGLEPQEIARLYTEHKGMLDAIHEGIIAINDKMEITLVNRSAIEILNLEEKEINNIIGRNILELYPTSQMVNVLKSGEAEYNREQNLNNTIIVTNRVPIKSGQKIVGVIATFRDKTMINNMAEEITGVKLIIDALRANNHEFMNKLHVILGLIHLKEYEEAKSYIINETDKQQQITSKILKNIHDSTIAALILGKLSRARELGIKLTLEEDSVLEKHSGKINSNVLVKIIGNIVENAMDALEKTNKEVKTIKIFINEFPDKLVIKVFDTGVGIPEEAYEKIFERGVTTKRGSTGVGLFLVKQLVESLEGRITLKSVLNEYTEFYITIPKSQ